MKVQERAWLNFAALILVNLLWAAQYPAYKIAGDGMESAALNFWTLLFAAVLLISPERQAAHISTAAVRRQKRCVDDMEAPPREPRGVRPTLVAYSVAPAEPNWVRV